MYQLTFKNGEIKDISDEQGKILLQAFCLGKEKFIFEKTLRNFSSVLDIKPAKNEDSNYPKLPMQVMTNWTKEKKLKVLRSMREGFLRGVADANNLTPGQSKMLENMDRLILKAENISITQITTPFTAVYGGI